MKFASYFFCLFVLAQLSQFYLKHNTAHVIWVFWLISTKAFFFSYCKKKKNAHNALFLKQRFPLKTEKWVFIKNKMLKGRKRARTSSSSHLPHTRCKFCTKRILLCWVTVPFFRPAHLFCKENFLLNSGKWIFLADCLQLFPHPRSDLSWCAGLQHATMRCHSLKF